MSITLSAVLVGTLVGNAHIESNIGYPTILEPVGFILMMVGFMLVIPPAALFLSLQKIGLGWELRGRESFIQLNPGFWIYCVGFYAVAIYLVRRLWRRRQLRRSTGSDGGDGQSERET